MTPRQIELVAQHEARQIPGFDPADLTRIQNKCMKDLERAEKKCRQARSGAPACIQELARENLEFAIARAEEYMALCLEEF